MVRTMTKMIYLFLVGLVCWMNEGVLGATTAREPSIQAYGLPKRFLTNGFIQRTNVDEKPRETSGVDGVEASNVRGEFTPKVSLKNFDDDGLIEIFHLDANHRGVSSPRNARSIDNRDGINIGNDLMAEESKVFRPLFVYRQQVLARQRRQRSKRNHTIKQATPARSNKKLAQMPYLYRRN